MPLAQRISDARAPVMFPAPLTGHWLEVVSHLDPKYGGLSAAVPNLGTALLQSSRISIELAAFCAPGEQFQPDGYAARSLSYWPTSRGTWLHNPKLRLSLEQTVRRADGVHIHGLWEQSTKVAAKVARALGKPYVLSAHGMLDPWALQHRRLKKLAYAALVERNNVRRAACLHALTQAEAEDYRRFGAKGPIAVIPNGVHIPADCNPGLFLDRYPELIGKRLILYLGRLHGKKGIDLLVKAYARLASEWPGTHLVLAGPDSEGTQAALQQLIAAEALGSRVFFTGMLQAEMKWSAFAAAACFVLPSLSEGLSVGVLEAMGMGLPVIVTEHCNMPEVAKFEAGWIVAAEVNPLATALEKFLQNPDAVNAKIGCRGRDLVQQRFNWASVAARMAEVYRWVRGGPTPTTVEILR